MTLEQAAELALAAAEAAGATDAEAWADESQGLEVRVYREEVESLTDAGGRGIGLRVFVDGRSGYGYGTDLSEPALRALAERAHAGAAASDPDEHAGLPESFGASEVGDLHSPEFDSWTTERKVELAIAVDRAARAQEGVSQVEQTVYADGRGRVAIANSRGFAAAYESSSAWAYSSAFAGKGADLMTGLGVGMARDPGGLDPEAVGSEAAERALALVGARQPGSRRCPVVLDAFVAASFAGFIGGMLSADSVQRGRSLFAGKLGDEVAAPILRLADDPTDPGGLASAPFDGEGSPTRRNALIEDGRLATYLYDARTARKDGRETTGSATRGSYRSAPSVGTSNLVLDAGDKDLDALVRDAGDGLFVTDVAGLHSGVNPVSGTFSVGATGRLIEGGQLGSPVREITIASDLVSMLKAVRAVGSEARWVPFGGSVKAAPLLLEEMSVGGS
ncbi:MAG TPA: TldD/PmbA family protein [Thermoleophilaceae bacterium]|nr:TldD/PmbA family protein [Thermoleophilaceae bacterium]